MASAQLRRRAEARGVTTAYRDWRGSRVQVSDETLMAVLDALGGPGSSAPGPGLGQFPAPAAGNWPSQGRPSGDPAAPAPPHRSWGFTVQLYSVRSRRSWGHGDLRDLADLAAWSAELGAAFVLINPLHAAEPAPPVSPSPYQPMSRRFISPLYLRVEDIPEYAQLPAGHRQRLDDLAAPLRASNASGALIDRDAVWTAKRAALELIHAVPLPPGRRATLERFCIAEGQALDDWATWCALAEVHGPDWRLWPGGATARPRRRGTEGAGAPRRPGQVPRLAAMGGGRTAGRRAGGRPLGGHEHRRDRRPGGRRAPGRRRHLGATRTCWPPG